MAPGLSRPRRWPLLLDALALLLEGYNKAILLGKHNDVRSHHLLKSCCREQWELPAALLPPCSFLLSDVSKHKHEWLVWMEKGLFLKASSLLISLGGSC